MRLRPNICLPLIGLLLGGVALVPAGAAELTVCTDDGCPYSTIAAASAAAHDGDTIVLAPGLYHEPAVLTANRLTLRAMPGAHLVDNAIEEKAALVIKGDDVLVDGLECSGVALPNGNGACIRMEGRNLTLRNVHFHDAQEGILAGRLGRDEKGVLLIERSRLERLGFGSRAHAIYVGEPDLTLHVVNSEILASTGEGHEIKSRGRKTIVEDSVVASLDGLDSRLIDIPNGGKLIVRNSLLQVGPYSQNPDMIGVGLERGRDPSRDQAETSILIEGNTILVQTGAETRLTDVNDGPQPVVRHNRLIGGAPDWGEGNVWYVDLAAAPPGIADRLPKSRPEPVPQTPAALRDLIDRQLMRAVSAVWLSRRYPRYVHPGRAHRWLDTDASGASSGYFAGALWRVWRLDGRAAWKAWAEDWTARLATRSNDAGAPAVGRVAESGFGLGYEFTGNPQYRAAMLAAARSLAARYDPTIRALRSWELDTWHFPVTIGTLMDLNLLLRAARLGGDATLRDIAIAHARRIVTDFLRPDGSTVGLVDYDPATGAVLSKHGRADAARDTNADVVRARGQAYAIHGFATLAEKTRDGDFLAAATKAARFYLAKLPPDGVPYNDLHAPADTAPLRDSAAAAIAASGLLALAPQLPDPFADTCRRAAMRTLRTLASADYLALDQLNGGILRHGVASVPDGDDVDVTLIEGDYYFLEALDRAHAAGLEIDFATPVATVPQRAEPAPASPADDATPAQQVAAATSGLVFAPEGTTVTWRGAPIALTPREMAVLRALVAQGGVPVAIDTLQQSLRDVAAIDGDGTTVRETVLALRRKFRAADRFFHAIVFVPRGGFAWQDTDVR